MDTLESFAPPVDIEKEMAETPEPANEPQNEVQQTVEEPQTPEETLPEPVKQVPLAALTEARRESKSLKAKLEEMSRQHAEALETVNKRLEALINPLPAVPNFEENPAENLRQRQERLEAEQKAWAEERNKQAQETQRQTQERQVIQAITTAMETHENEFRAKSPDYDEAVAYLQKVADANLLASGVTDPMKRREITMQQSLALAANALQNGQNPAEVAYKFAKNYGYQAKVDAAKQVKAQAEAQSRTQNIGNGKTDTPLSIKALEQMDDDEFNAAIADDSKWRKIIRQI